MTVVKTKMAPTTLEASWRKVQNKLRTELGDEVYGAWFARLQFKTMEDLTLTLSVGNRVTARYIANTYDSHLLKACKSEFKNIARICIESRVLKVSGPESPVIIPPPTVLHRNRSTEPTRSPAFVAAEIMIELIIQVVCETYLVSERDLLSASRRQEIITPRRIVFYLAQQRIGNNGRLIRKRCGRDNATVSNGAREVRELMSTNPSFKKKLEGVQRMLCAKIESAANNQSADTNT